VTGCTSASTDQAASADFGQHVRVCAQTMGFDEDAFGFLVASALHNLLIAGEAWPRPDPAPGRRTTPAMTGLHDATRH
jgi:hypothetical protein